MLYHNKSVGVALGHLQLFFFYYKKHRADIIDLNELELRSKG